MQINRVQINNYNNPNFGAITVTPRAAQVLNKTFNTEQLEQLRMWRKELKDTKHFDLEISAVMEDLVYSFRHKTNPHLDSESPLRPIYSAYNKVAASGTDLIDVGDSFAYNNLRFPSEAQAAEAYKTLKEHEKACTPYHRNDFKALNWAVDATKILDKATEHTGSESIRIIKRDEPFSKVSIYEPIRSSQSTKSIKQFFIERIKNAWNALIGN